MTGRACKAGPGSWETHFSHAQLQGGLVGSVGPGPCLGEGRLTFLPDNLDLILISYRLSEKSRLSPDLAPPTGGEQGAGRGQC